VRLHIARSRRPGDGYAYIVENYRDAKGRPTHRTVEKLGRVLDLAAADPAWREAAEARAAELTAAKDAARGMVAYDLTERADPRGALNWGWMLADAAYERLGLSSWLARRRRDKGWGVDVAAALRMLVASRVLWPGSKRAAAARQGRLLGGGFDMPLDEVYRALDPLCEEAARVQARARRAVAGQGEALDCVFYDVTNYFFEIDQPDPAQDGHDPPRGEAVRRRGFSKEHRQSPIIQMGLFMDASGVPVSYRLFHGSSPDSATLAGALGEFKATFGAPRVTVVADGAMNSAANLAALDGAGDGWTVASSIRKAGKDLRQWVLDPAGWSYQMDDEGRVASMSKSQIRVRALTWKDPDGRKHTKHVTEKVVARWSAAHAARERATRAEMAAKAAALAADPAKLKASNRRGVKKYVKQELADPATGEVASQPRLVTTLDQARLDKDAQLDGYWLCHTSQLDASDAEILGQYRELWKIEDAFRVTKTDLETRPVYVWTPKHVEAHFLICFLGLLVTRLLQAWAGHIPSGQLRQLLADAVATPAADGLYLVARPETWDVIDEATGVGTDRKWVTAEGLRARRRAWRQAFAPRLVPLRETTPA
jgi:hypothetical protein